MSARDDFEVFIDEIVQASKCGLEATPEDFREYELYLMLQEIRDMKEDGKGGF